MTTLEKDDIQALVFNAYPKNPSCKYLMLRVVDAARARAWLAKIAGALTTGETRDYGTTMNLAVSARGLQALGLPSDALATFSHEFFGGMAGEEHRSRILGDTDDSAPERWEWGGTKSSPVHLMLMVFARNDTALEACLAERRAEYAGALEEVFVRDTVWLDKPIREHFGFADGIAQPTIDGTQRAGSGGSTVKAGEFVLGYPNEYDKLPLSPSVRDALDPGGHLRPLSANGGPALRDLGRNGTYLVVRQLDQDVQGFWRAMEDYGRTPAGEVDRQQAIRIAAKCVGRWPSGAPLVKSPDRDDPALGGADDFMYFASDPRGLACPIGSHIRRTNPRDSLEPGPEASLEVVNRHRIMRRGRSYGKPLERFATEDPPQTRGLFFICINTNIRRQFEFIQQTWCNNPKFGGLYEDKDPLLGDQPREQGGMFTIPEVPVRRRLTNLARFVHVRGGEYFFMPSVRAVRFLGALPAQPMAAGERARMGTSP